jgi:hypothetical protein
MPSDVEAVKANIASFFEKKKTATIALCSYYAALALQTFRERQIGDEFWNNQTNTAYNTVFAESFSDGESVGWFIAHAIEYGVYLEIANDRRHESLRPIVEELFPQFELDLKEIWNA